MDEGRPAASAVQGRGRGRGRGILTVERGACQPPKVGALISSSQKSGPDPAKGGGGGIIDSCLTPSLSVKTKENYMYQLNQQLETLTFDVQETDLDAVQDLAVQCAKTEKDLKEITQLVYNRCLADIDFAKPGALICNRLSKLEGNGVGFRSYFLRLLQSDFSVREHLKATSPEKFNAFVAFLCQVFSTMKTVNGEVFVVLVGPVFQCLEILVDGNTVDELDCLSLQCVGKLLQACDPKKMQNLLDKVRLRIIREPSPQVCCVLLELIEIQAHGWETLPSDIMRFYCDTYADILVGMIV